MGFFQKNLPPPVAPRRPPKRTRGHLGTLAPSQSGHVWASAATWMRTVKSIDFSKKFITGKDIKKISGKLTYLWKITIFNG
jgi:hypothetical protein